MLYVFIYLNPQNPQTLKTLRTLKTLKTLKAAFLQYVMRNWYCIT